MDLTAYLRLPRTIGGGAGFHTRRPADPAAIRQPEVRAAVRALVAGKATEQDKKVLRQHWMLVD